MSSEIAASQHSSARRRKLEPKNQQLKIQTEYSRFNPARLLNVRLLLHSTGLLTLAVLPHLNHLRFEIIAIFLLMAGWRCVACRWHWLPRNRWIILLFAMVGFTVSAWYYGAPLGRDPGVAFLVVMAGLKVLEVSSPRDIRIVLLLGLFVIITHFLYADGILWSLPLLGLVVALIWSMAQTEHVNPRRFMLSDLKLVARMFIQALPFVLILFYLFPRLAGSVYLFQSENQSGTTGLSDRLTMGSISNLIQSEDIAFTASFFNQTAPPPEQRYWRGGVLWDTDGRQWTRGLSAPFLKRDPYSNPADGHQQRYEIELEPNKQDWLFSLDFPVSIPPNADIDSDHHLYIDGKTDGSLRYTLISSDAPQIEPLSENARARALDLGDTIITPRMRALIGEFTEGTKSSIQIAQRVFDYYNKNEFVYTLQPPLLGSNAPVDEFLFESRRGFCGHYASSFATIMRRAGVPARLVVGYLGGKFNPRSNQIVVHQSDAHAWVEIWQQNSGWIRMDPTAAIAPERIQFPIDFNTSINSAGSVLFSMGEFAGFRRLFIELEWLSDSIKAKWNRWFTTFDQSRQQQLLKSLGLDHLDSRLLSMGAFVGALATLSLLSFVIFQRDQVKPDPVVRVYQRYCNRLKKLGMTRRPNEGPVDFSARARLQFPDFEKQIDNITLQFITLRYASPDSVVSPAELARFSTMVVQFEREVTI